MVLVPISAFPDSIVFCCDLQNGSRIQPV